jgi:hypothetical protein
MAGKDGFFSQISRLSYHAVRGAPLAGDPLEVWADAGGVELQDLPGLGEADGDLPVPTLEGAERDPDPPGIVDERVDGGVLRGGRARRGLRRAERRGPRADAPRQNGLPERAVGALGLDEGVVVDRVVAGLGVVLHHDGRKVGPAQAGLVREQLHGVAGLEARQRRLRRRRVAAARVSRRPHRWWWSVEELTALDDTRECADSPLFSLLQKGRDFFYAAFSYERKQTDICKISMINVIVFQQRS